MMALLCWLQHPRIGRHRPINVVVVAVGAVTVAGAGFGVVTVVGCRSHPSFDTQLNLAHPASVRVRDDHSPRIQRY